MTGDDLDDYITRHHNDSLLLALLASTKEILIDFSTGEISPLSQTKSKFVYNHKVLETSCSIVELKKYYQ